MNTKKLLLVLLLALSLLAASISLFGGSDSGSAPSLVTSFDYSWTEDNRYIAHACGSINGISYSNSKEALEENYAKGCRIFEVDLLETADGKLVCWHSFTTYDLVPEEFTGTFPTEEEFLSMEIKGGLHTMDFGYVVDFMSEHDDVYIVTDTKTLTKEDTLRRFTEIRDIASAKDASVLDRIIPQLYYPEMKEEVMSVYDWRSLIYTMYLVAEGTRYGDVMDYVTENGIGVVTVSVERANDTFIRDLNERGIKVYINTVDSEKEAAAWKERGVYGFYTNDLI